MDGEEDPIDLLNQLNNDYQFDGESNFIPFPISIRIRLGPLLPPLKLISLA